MFIIFILYHILYIIFQIKKQKNQFIPLPIEEGDFLIRLLKDGVHIRTLSYIFMVFYCRIDFDHHAYK